MTSAATAQATDSPDLAAPHRRRGWTLFVTCAGVALVIASMVALNTAIGDIAVATSATQSQLTWIVDGYTVVLACLLLPAGAIGDRYGRRRALLVGLAVFALASIAPIFLHRPEQIIVSRALAGAGAAFVMPATLSLLTAVYPREERTKAVGIWAGVCGSGGVAGMLGSGALLAFFPWQSIFVGLGAAGALLFALTLTVSTSRQPDAPPVDWPGATLIGAAVAVFVFGILKAPRDGWDHPLVYGCMAGGAALAVVFGFVELSRSRPLLDMRLFRNPEFLTGAAAVTVVFGSNFGLVYVVMQYMQQIVGYSPIRTALALAPLGVPIVTFSALSSWYLPKLGLRVVMFWGLGLVAAGLWFFRGVHLGSSYVDLVWPLIVFATGTGFITAPMTSAIMRTVPDQKQGVASAVNDITREVGGALFIAIAGSILASGYGSRLTPYLSAFPQPVRDSASHSLAEALKISQMMGPHGEQLAQLSRSAFLEAMHWSMFAMAIIVAAAAVPITLWAPGRNGQQLRPVRRMIHRFAPARSRPVDGAQRRITYR